MDQSRTDPTCGRLWRYSLRVGSGRAVLSLTIDLAPLPDLIVYHADGRSDDELKCKLKDLLQPVFAQYMSYFHFHVLRLQLSIRGK